MWDSKPLQKVSVGQAFANLILKHLAKGSWVLVLRSSEVIMRPQYDDIPTDYYFGGAEREMRPLVLAAAYEKELCGELASDTMIRVVDSIHRDDPDFQPMNIHDYATLLTRYGSAKLVALAAVGIEPTDELCSLELSHIVAAIELALDNTDADVMELLASS